MGKSVSTGADCLQPFNRPANLPSSGGPPIPAARRLRATGVRPNSQAGGALRLASYIGIHSTAPQFSHRKIL